jgi:UDP-galactopyranose mutase
MEEYDIIVVGAGLSGCVLAERFARIKNKQVLIIETT